MKNKSLVLPALRGSFGDWIYYTCLMPLTEVGLRVNYAEEIHPERALSMLIQRSLEGARARHIAEYLTKNKERFFNSLVLATYGGSPDWLEIGNFSSSAHPGLLASISETAMDSLGFLRLSGNEKIFAIDGQHRLAGIKHAMVSGIGLEDEQVPVLLVGHKKSVSGLRRTRRLFTTLNKTAVPVRKRDIIALDEDDVMAIIARRLVETNPSFRDPKIAVIASQNIPATNQECLTTISSLYDILKLIFMHELRARSDRNLRFNRPDDERLDHYYEVATKYFAAVGRSFKPVQALFVAKNPKIVTAKHRGIHGGHILFRPIGLEIFTRLAIEIAEERRIELPEAVKLLADFPTDLNEFPYAGVIWDAERQAIVTRGKTLARELLRYIAGLGGDKEKLEREYGKPLPAKSAGTLKLVRRRRPGTHADLLRS